QFQISHEAVFAFRAHHKAYGQVAEINFMYGDVAARQFQVKTLSGVRLEGSLQNIRPNGRD
ncbi:MAG: hypothetical protein AAFY76_01485, partial [Cyanobacteria bacterium J06649_11]